MSWLRSLWAWLMKLLGLINPSPWTQTGNVLTGTVSGLIDTTRPIVDSNAHPHAWTVSANRKSISTNLGA
jgi:hypothetical protein